MTNSKDPHDELIHKVQESQVVAYKAGAKRLVYAECGKVWAPTFPIQGNVRTIPRCPVCYPKSEQTKFVMAK